MGKKTDRDYVIYLSKSKSMLALVACFITIVFSCYAIAGGMVEYVEDDQAAGLIFQWFTTLSNSITCLGAAMIMPFAVEGIRKKHFSLPKWVSVFLYTGMVCTTMTMIFSVGFISWFDPTLAFGGYNTYLHIVCPVMVIISFFMIESGFLYSVKDSVIASVPAFIYVMIYTYEVIIVGEGNGGWEDFYHILDHAPVPVAVAGVALLALGISFLIRFINNKRVEKTREKLMSRLLPESVSPTEIKIEVFGLGRYMGKHSDIEYVELHMDVIHAIAEQYDMRTEDLVRPYIKGFFDSFNEKNRKS